MPRVSAAFFAFGVLCLLTGMGVGIVMAASENFTVAAAHAHLNLLGWVTMSLYGIFYALTRGTMSERLAWTNFVLSGLGVLIMIPGLFLYLLHNDPKITPVIAVGSILSVLGLIVFGISVARELFRPRT